MYDTKRNIADVQIPVQRKNVTQILSNVRNISQVREYGGIGMGWDGITVIKPRN